MNKETNRNRFYLHEVEIKNKLQFSIQVRNYMDENHPNRNTETEASKLRISKLFAECKFTASKVIDENGEPKIVYYGTTYDFTEFGPGRGAYMVQECIFFQPQRIRRKLGRE